MEKKCVICGKPAIYESMTMASPVCEECAKNMVEMYIRNRNISLEDGLEEVYVPVAGDITAIREK